MTTHHEQVEIALVLETDAPELVAAAANMRKRLSITSHEPTPDTLLLAVRDDRLELRRFDDRPGRGVALDWSSIRSQRLRGPIGRRHPFGKAIGRARSVFDATAGLGQDSLLCACMGCSVFACERHPIIHALLTDGIRRARLDDVIGSDAVRVQVCAEPADAANLFADHHVDVVYLDPMFPAKRHASALPPKSMQVFQLLSPHGDDDDAALLDAARSCARQRVVVKRPHHAPPLRDDLSHSLEGKVVRYDVYVTGGVS